MTEPIHAKTRRFDPMGPFTREGVNVGRGLNICEFNIDRKYCWVDGTPLTRSEIARFKQGLIDALVNTKHSHA